MADYEKKVKAVRKLADKQKKDSKKKGKAHVKRMAWPYAVNGVKPTRRD